MKSFKSFMESLNEEFMRGDSVRVIEKGHKYYGKIGVILKAGTGKQKGVSVVRFVDGQNMSFTNNDEIEMVDVYED